MPAGEDVHVPKAIRALWSPVEPGRRGPKPAMSVRSIAEAAATLADADGLEAASMAAVAAKLGFTTMSLYRYVDSKRDLQAVMMDTAIGPPPPLNRRRGWRGQLEEWARANAVQMKAHPWILDVRAVGPPMSPNFLAWMDRGMEPLVRAGVPPQAAASALLILDGFVNNHVELGRRYSDEETNRAWSQGMRELLTADDFPTLSSAVEAGTFDDDESEFPDDEFGFGLRLVLDGIEQLVARSR
jgi:AcrR family transcriptional regulator